MAYLFRDRLIKKMLWGSDDFPMAIYHENVYRQLKPMPKKYVLARLTLNNGDIVDIEGGFEEHTLTQNMNLPYSATCVSAEITNDCTIIAASSFNHFANLTSVTIPNTVTYIGGNTFLGSGLIAATVPNGVTELGNGVFAECSNLTSVTIPDSVITIGFSAFQDSKKLNNVTIGSGVTTMGRSMFARCTALRNIYMYPSTPPTLGDTAFYNMTTYTIYVPASSVNAYKTATNWKSASSHIQAMP